MLRRAQVEAGERRAADRPYSAELHQAGHAQPLDGPLCLYPELLPDRDVLLASGLAVDDDLARLRPPAGHKCQRVEPRLRRIDAEPEIRCAAEHDRLAVASDQLRLAGDAADRCVDVGQRPDLRKQRFVE